LTDQVDAQGREQPEPEHAAAAHRGGNDAAVRVHEALAVAARGGGQVDLEAALFEDQRPGLLLAAA
jgi:hypothetical protein